MKKSKVKGVGMLPMMSAKDKVRRPERKQKHKKEFKNWQDR